MNFDDITAASDIQNYATSDPDGEDLHFEKKGTAGRTSFNREDKKNFAKEICAFANTYGGVLVVHAGEDNDLEPFPESEASRAKDKLERWVSDSLSPVLVGIRVKLVEGFIVVGVPVSTVKPHQARTAQRYYYRSGSDSKPMPEVFIRAMYQSRATLDIQIELVKSEMQSGDALIRTFKCRVRNSSTIAGTHPQISFWLWTNNEHHSIEHNHKTFDTEVASPCDDCEVPVGMDWFTDHKLIYPMSSIESALNIFRNGGSLPRFYVARVDAVFKESPAVSRLFVVDFHREYGGVDAFALEDQNKLSAAFSERLRHG